MVEGVDASTYGPCQCQTEEWKSEQRGRLRAFASLPDGYKAATFEDMSWSPPQLTGEQRKHFVRCAEWCRKYALSQTDEKWLLLAGSKGWGKTHLAACIVNKRVERNEPAKFTTFRELLDEIKGGFSDNTSQETVKFYKETEFLVLDDLGAENQTDYSEAELYNIINYRYSNRLPTVITTNVNPSKIDSRVSDRMQDKGSGLAKVIHKVLPSYRTGKERA
jgi:DNA replication protein DnaC